MKFQKKQRAKFLARTVGLKKAITDSDACTSLPAPVFALVYGYVQPLTIKCELRVLSSQLSLLPSQFSEERREAFENIFGKADPTERCAGVWAVYSNDRDRQIGNQFFPDHPPLSIFAGKKELSDKRSVNSVSVMVKGSQFLCRLKHQGTSMHCYGTFDQALERGVNGPAPATQKYNQGRWICLPDYSCEFDGAQSASDKEDGKQENAQESKKS